MVSGRNDAKPTLHGHEGPRMTPQFSDNQPAGTHTSRQETEQSRAQRASGTETPSGSGTQQRDAQQTFAGDTRARGADAENHRQQSGFSADANAYYRAADAAAGYHHPFAQNYFYTPFGQYPFGHSPFGHPAGTAPFWPFGPPPSFSFPPFAGMPQGSLFPGMMQFAPGMMPFAPGMMPFVFPPFSDQSGQSIDPMRSAYPYASVFGWWNMLRSLWYSITSWWMWTFSGGPRGVPLPQNASPSFDPILRMAMAQADVMHQMLLKAAEVLDEVRKACQAFAEHGGAAYAPFGSTAAFSTAGSPSTPGSPPTPGSPSTPGSPGMARPVGPVDMEKLKQSLQTMDPIQAAQVLHAVHVVQAMDGAHRRQQAAGSGW
jgi:hypothetical protein